MSRDWKFCPYSGALLEMEPAKGMANCSMSGYTRNLSGIECQEQHCQRDTLYSTGPLSAELEHVKMVTHTDMEVSRAATPSLNLFCFS